MPNHTTIALLSLALALAAAPAAAFHEDDLPLLAADDITGTGWVRYDASSDGSTIAFDLVADLSAVPATAALLVSSPSTGAFMLTLVLTEGGPEVRLSSDALPEGVSVDASADTASGWTGAGLTLEGWSGPMTAVAWGAGGVGAVHAAVRGGAGNAVASSSSGSKTFMHSAEDFAGLNAGVTTGTVNPGVVVGSVSEQIGGTVVGQFFAIGETNLVGVTTQQASMTTPSGTTTCGCFWMDPNAPADAGTWTFDVTYASATFVSNVFLTGADLSG